MDYKTVSARFVVDEDSITRPTADGQPHEILTLVAGISGMIAAALILSGIIALIKCKDSDNTHNDNSDKSSNSSTEQSQNTGTTNESFYANIRTVKLENDDEKNKLEIIKTISKRLDCCENFTYEINDEKITPSKFKLPEITTGKF